MIHCMTSSPAKLRKLCPSDFVVGYTYLLLERDMESKVVKIGSGNSVANRLMSLQIGNATPLIVFGAIRDKVWESKLHSYFKQSKIRGEWYDFTRIKNELLAWWIAGKISDEALASMSPKTGLPIRDWPRGITKNGDVWTASIRYMNRSWKLGDFDNLPDACAAYNSACTDYYGKNAKLAVVPDWYLHPENYENVPEHV